MLFELSRALFWLAALATAITVLMPGARGPLLIGTAISAAALAWLCRRAASLPGVQRVRHAPLPLTLPAFCPRRLVADAAECLGPRLDVAATLDAALRVTVNVLRRELGAAQTRALSVLELHETYALLVDLAESEAAMALPLALTAWRHPHNDAPLSRALRDRCITGQLPRLALPIVRDGRVLAVIELAGFELEVEAGALDEFLGRIKEQLDGIAISTEPFAHGWIPACVKMES